MWTDTHRLPNMDSLTLEGIFLLTCLSTLLHFEANFRSRSWEPLAYPDHPHDIEDPFFRWVSYVRWCARASLPNPPSLAHPHPPLSHPH